MITVEEKQEIIDEIINGLHLSIKDEGGDYYSNKKYIKFTLSYIDKNGQEHIISQGETNYLS